MVDAEVSALGWTFLIDLIIFLVYISIFFAIRTSRGDRSEFLPNFERCDTTKIGLTAQFSRQDLKPSAIENESEETLIF